MRSKTRKSLILLAYLLFFLICLFGTLSITGKLKHLINDLLINQGYRVSNIEMRGYKNLDQQFLLSILEPYRNQSILAISISDIRQEILQTKWASKVSVLRKLPDKIIVVVDEYKPFAFFNNESIITDNLITVIPIETEQEKKVFTDLLKIQGQNLTRAVKILAALKKELEKENVDKLALIDDISGRRWNLIFRSGTLVKLPEHNLDKALGRLTSILQKNPTLSGIKKIDLRLEDKTFVS